MLLRRCFVIGPMKDMNRLNQLASIVDSLLEELGYKYEVSTPDHAEMGLVMNQVLLSLEQSDLLIADLTDNNPNVMYELGIYHAFGKPYIAVKEQTGRLDKDKTPFDVQAHRYLTINLQDSDSTRSVLQDFLIRSQLLQKADKIDYFSNPVTDFYGSPIAEIPTAIGLAKNYTKNFMLPILPDIFNVIPGTDHYPVGVQIEETPNGQPGRRFNALRSLTLDERDNLQIEILIPNDLAWSEKKYLTDLQQSPQRPFLNAQVIADRTYNCYAQLEPDGTVVIIDVPTILSSLNQSIERRRRSIQDVNIKAEGWEILERQEIERFEAKCKTFLETNLSPINQQRGRVVRWQGK